MTWGELMEICITRTEGRAYQKGTSHVAGNDARIRLRSHQHEHEHTTERSTR
jgi:hypothetical protein